MTPSVTTVNHLNRFCHYDDADGDERNVVVLFHNLKGYEGMFVLHNIYAEHYAIEQQICQGVKVFSFMSGNITFKDSLCFIPAPLASFPAMSGLTELKKGFLPQLFNTQENQDYEGPMPLHEYCDPDAISSKKKAEFDT